MQIHQALAELGFNVKPGTRHSSHVNGAKKAFSIHKRQFNPDGSAVVTWSGEQGDHCTTRVAFFNRASEAHATGQLVSAVEVLCEEVNGVQRLKTAEPIMDVYYKVAAIFGSKHAFTAMFIPVSLS